MRIFKNSTLKRHIPMNFTGIFRGDLPSLLGLGFLALGSRVVVRLVPSSTTSSRIRPSPRRSKLPLMPRCW